MNGMMGDQRDPGAVDNRLTLDPSDPKWKDIIAKWEDGGKYAVTLELDQMAPGDFEVTSLKAEGEAPADAVESETPAEAQTPDEETELPTKNPAIRRMMAK